MCSFPEYASSAKELDPNLARVLMVGPMMSGKTTLVRSLCRGRADDIVALRRSRRPPPTVGCNVDVKVLAGGRSGRSVEFWDVGGNPEAALARKMFYEDSSIAGVLLVYDVTNRRSLRDLREWSTELTSAGIRTLPTVEGNPRSRGDGSILGDIWEERASLVADEAPPKPAARRREYKNRGKTIARGRGNDVENGVVKDDDHDVEQGGSRSCGASLPFLVVGNKRDVGEGVREEGEAFAKELDAPHVTVSAREWGDGSEDMFDRFFDAVFKHLAVGFTIQGAPFEGDSDSSWNFPDDSNTPSAAATVRSGGWLRSSSEAGASAGGGAWTATFSNHHGQEFRPPRPSGALPTGFGRGNGLLRPGGPMEEDTVTAGEVSWRYGCEEESSGWSFSGQIDREQRFIAGEAGNAAEGARARSAVQRQREKQS